MAESSIEKPSTPPGKSTPPSLMKRVIRGSIWAIGDHAISQIIRLGSNLILSRLLFPEAFGLMTLVFTFISGLEMLSDFGVGPSIIQNKRGDDPKFLNTAFTIHAIRGTILWLCICAIAFPISQFYREPLLQWLLPVAGLGNFMSGFVSTKWATANRHLDLARLTVMDLSAQIISVVIVVVCAWIAHTTHAPRDLAIWSLVVGSLVGTVLRLILSHTYLQGHNNRFEWDKEAAKELASFGRWIFLSTLLTFFAMQGTNLVFPRLVGIGFLGVFSFAQSLSQSASNVVDMLTEKVFFPSYSELVRERPERLYEVMKRSRIALNLMNWAVCLFLIFFGQWLIKIMYDDRYANAGWILQILSLGMLVSVLGSTYTRILMAQGKTFYMTALMVVQVALQFTALLTGYYFGGEFGAVVGNAAVGWALYPFQAICYARLKIWQPEIDLPALALATGIAAFVLWR